MNSSRIHIEKLHSLVGEFEHASGDEVIGKMLPEIGSLMVALGEELDSAQRKVVRLTWALFWLTAILLVVGIAQLVVSISFAPSSVVSQQQPKTTIQVPPSRNDANSTETPNNKR